MKIKILLLVVLLFEFFVSAKDSEAAMQRLKTSDNGRFLAKEDGAPFFWMGDTAWSLATVSPADVAEYLDNRLQNGFNIIQVDADAYGGNNYAGKRPFFNDNPALPMKPGGSILTILLMRQRPGAFMFA